MVFDNRMTRHFKQQHNIIYYYHFIGDVVYYLYKYCVFEYHMKDNDAGENQKYTQNKCVQPDQAATEL